MEKSQTAKVGLGILLAGGLLMSSSSAQAITTKHVVLAFTIATIARLAVKDDPKKDRLTLEVALDKVREQLSNPFSKDMAKLLKDMAKLLWEVLDDIIIGYKGKIAGLKPFGSKIIIDGEAKITGTSQSGDGEKIELRRFDHIWPYGLCGWLWAYCGIIGKELKTLDDVMQLGQKDHLFDNFYKGK